MPRREVTEKDFRMPEYRDAKVEDYEFRADGQLVRKDRWEQGIQSIRFLVGINGREFEIPDVIDAVRKLAKDADGWVPLPGQMDPEDLPRTGESVELRLSDGSVLRNASYHRKEERWLWNGTDVPLTVVEWRESPEPESNSGEAS